jgi:hypothetical protein
MQPEGFAIIEKVIENCRRNKFVFGGKTLFCWLVFFVFVGLMFFVG